MSEVKEIKQSVNRVQVVGTLKEINLKQETKELELSYGDKKKKVTCETIGKIEFTNPMFLVEVNGQDVGVEMFGASEKKLDENGKVVDNKRFKALQTILNTYVPKVNCKGEEKPTRAQFDGMLTENSYAKDEDFKAFTQITAFSATHNSVPEEDYAKGEMTGIIKNMLPEVRVVNEEETETGRLKVEFYYFDKNGNTFPVNFVVEKEWVEPLEDLYSVGDSGKVFFDIVVKQIGGKPKTTSSGGFGRREEITTGFNITEYSIIGADDKFEEESEYFIEIGQMKEALNARQIMMDTKIEEAKKRAESPKEKKADPKSFGKKDGVKGSTTGNPFD